MFNAKGSMFKDKNKDMLLWGKKLKFL